MNMALWILTGAVAGWIAFAWLGWNEGRSLFVSVVLGTVGGLAGGSVVAPMFTAAPVAGGGVLFMPIAIAIVCALALLVAADQALKRWDF